MNAQKVKNREGFTIIEVVLVLAIAALIFLMVFIALPALQRNQRDAAAKQEVGNVVSAITTFQSNNRGRLPNFGTANDAQILARYLDSSNPTTAVWNSTNNVTTGILVANDEYSVKQGSNSTAGTFDSALNVHPYRTIWLYTNTACDPSNTSNFIVKARSVAVFTNLENGGNATDGTPYCQS